LPGRHIGEAGHLIWRNFLRPIPCDFASRSAYNPLKRNYLRRRSGHLIG
jgi:hypothetical protein